jgi:hypothetical protein
MFSKILLKQKCYLYNELEICGFGGKDGKQNSCDLQNKVWKCETVCAVDC